MNTSDWTFGAEHELADWDITTPLPEGFKRDVRDITIVNSNGIANDPTGRSWKLGGEINTPPTATKSAQAGLLPELLDLLPAATVNYRSNLHVHVRVPGLKDNLWRLKQIQRYIHEHMRAVLAIIQPMGTRPTAEGLAAVYGRCPDHEEVKGAERRWRRMRMSHQTLLTSHRLVHQLEAETVEEFFEREVPRSSKGQVMWHAQPRLCVNLRQLRETDTVEFRHFAGTLDTLLLYTALDFAERFLVAAIEAAPIEPLLEWCRQRPWPTFAPYNHKLETRYRATVHDGTIPREQIERNIARILEEDAR
jgi:hypothetical protein